MLKFVEWAMQCVQFEAGTHKSALPVSGTTLNRWRRLAPPEQGVPIKMDKWYCTLSKLWRAHLYDALLRKFWAAGGSSGGPWGPTRCRAAANADAGAGVDAPSGAMRSKSKTIR